MSFILPEVVPWGRSYSEYVDMFDLGNQDLMGSVLGCGDGPASFNATMDKMGHYVISCDPLYSYSLVQIENMIKSAREKVMDQVRRNQSNFIWEYFSDPVHLEETRLSAMGIFLKDYNKGKDAGRYLPHKLPYLPFPDKEFGIALCSHFLFLYPELGFKFHLESILEMLRVSKETRIYPVVDVNCQVPEFREVLFNRLRFEGFNINLVKVRYNFIRNGDKMLKISLKT